MALATINRPQFCIRACVLGLMAIAGAAGIVLGGGPTFDAPSVSAQQIGDIEAKYEAERADAEKTGASKKFSLEQFKQANLLAERGKANLAAGRLAEAREAFRQARWYL